MGQTHRALELCFSAKLFDSLRQIVQTITEGEASRDTSLSSGDPTVLAKCASFFMEHSQYDKAVELLCMTDQFETAVDLCYEHGVPITDSIADRLTPEKNETERGLTGERYLTQLKKIAKLCKDQGNFQSACKKYTQAGDKLKAMKCLLKSGDTEKIAFFAGTARQPEIYVIAANYLQGLDWGKDSALRKQILSFYSKARDYRKMAGFYSSMAQAEIDLPYSESSTTADIGAQGLAKTFAKYENAAVFFRDGVKVLQKGSLEASPEAQDLEKRLECIKQFDCLKTMATEDQIAACTGFLATPGVDDYLRK